MRRLLTVLFVLVTTCLTSCFNINESRQIIGPYFIGAVDVSENMGIFYYENEDRNSSQGYVVYHTVYEIEWNDSFIVAKQHPTDGYEERVLDNYREHIFDSLKQSNQLDRIHLVSDSLSKVKFELNEKAGLFDEFKGQDKKSLTLYYLIDTRDKSSNSTLFLNQRDLDSALINLNVGKLDNKKYFEYLDRKE